MAILKCKMCGGDLEIQESTTVVECEYCGTKQTVPAADNEKKMTLFNRANRLRFACEFDKAAGVYESIVVDFPEEAEAYWGLVLCKYGIEYVDDPATGKKVPTCHRSSFESVMDDSNFEQTLENADPIAHSVYRDEAKQIEELRKGIIEVSGKEAPYDIFICYKETAENGERTIDSVIAQDVYDELTAKGYRVFFSRITLEDKLGQEYEPYIFAALNSAKIMLAFGTDYEYYNAVWVKNEWSRFLQLIAKGEKKTLIPCYKNIDAYDMPKEFAKLQAQDMGKIGAIQDLLRGIEKLLPKKVEVNETIKERVVIQQASPQSATVDSLMKRAFAFLEDGEWAKAEEYCNKVLDISIECADAYVGLLMVELKISKEQELADLHERFDQNKNFQKALRYASSERRDVLGGYAKSVEDYIAEQKRIAEERVAEQKRIEEERIAELKRIEEERIAELKRIAEERIPILKDRRKYIERAAGIISAGSFHTVGLKSDGTVVSVGSNREGQRYVSDWRDIVAISAGSRHTVGLKPDGTVVAAAEKDFVECNVSGWRDIVAISANSYQTKGLKSDGSVVAVGINGYGQCDVSDWRDIVAISADAVHTIGLKSDGTVVAVGKNDHGQCDVSDWRDIVAISADAVHTIGLKLDGTVVAVGKNDEGQCDVSDWRDIVAISAGYNHTVGLKSDGTVVAAGKNDHGQCDVSGWNDIVAISTRLYHTVGLKSDGTVVAVGKNDEGQCDVSGWKLFKNIDTLEEDKRIAVQKRIEEDRIAEQKCIAGQKRMEEERKQKAERRSRGICQYCGGSFKGLFSKKCSVCGREKDY